MYLKKVMERGGVISSSIAVLAPAKGILLHYDRAKLAEHGGHIHLSSIGAFFY